MWRVWQINISVALYVTYYSIYGRKVYSRYIQPQVNVLLRSYYRDYRLTYTVLYALYSTVNAQQMNLLPVNTSQMMPLPKSLYHIHRTTLQCSYGCTITILYTVRMCI